MTAKISASASGTYGSIGIGANDSFRFGSDNSGQLTGFRNRLINGCMRIMQRLSHTPILSALDFFTDRWLSYSEGAANASITWLTTPTGGPSANMHYLSIMGAAGNTYSSVWQRLEAENVADLAGQTITVSAWVYSQDTRAVSFDLRSPPNRDDWSAGNTSLGVVATTAAQGWRRVSAQYTMPSNTLGIQLGISFGAVGAGLEMAITKVQLEQGSIMTPFEHRPLGLELSLCQRYYYRNVNPHYVGVCSSAVLMNRVGGLHPVPMRVTPTIAAPSGLALYDGIAVSTGNISINYSTPYNLEFDISGASGLTAGRAGIVYNDTTGRYIAVSAEL